MAGHNQNNAITERLDLLRDYWGQFREEDSSSVCRWLIQSDESQMIDLFYQLETSEEGEIPDLFMKFNVPFLSEDSYDRALLEELLEQIEADQAELEKEDLTLSWKPIKDNQNTGTNSPFFQNLASLARSIEDLEGYLVACLFPSDTTNTKHWSDWIANVMESGLPEGIKLMVVDLADQPTLTQLAKEFPMWIKTIEPELDMSGAMQQLAAAGDPQNPGVKFRKLFVNLGQAAAKGQHQQMELLSKKALSLASQEDWPDMQVAIHFLLASTWTSEQKYDQALNTYQRAGKIAENAYKTGNPLGGKLLMQAFFFMGGTHIGAGNYQAASEMYQQAIQLAEELEDHFNQMEACRMTGYCLEMIKDYQPAWDYNNQALDVSEKLDEELRMSSTLPYVGKALLRLISIIGEYQDELLIRQRMIQLVGADWEDKVEAGETVKKKA